MNNKMNEQIKQILVYALFIAIGILLAILTHSPGNSFGDTDNWELIF